MDYFWWTDYLSLTSIKRDIGDNTTTVNDEYQEVKSEQSEQEEIKSEEAEEEITTHERVRKYGDLSKVLRLKKNIPPQLFDNDLYCTETMFVSFKANRDIEIGEELFIDLLVDPVNNKYRLIGNKDFASYCI